MGTMSDDRARPPRFPFVAAFVCAACAGTAGWTWMRYSCVRDVVPEDLHVLGPRPGYAISPDGSRIRVPDFGGPYRPNVDLLGCYVRLHGTLSHVDEDADVPPRERSAWVQGKDPCRLAEVHPVAGLLESSDTDTEIGIVGRVLKAPDSGVAVDLLYPNLVVDPTRSRFHGASIFGLVVGATGVLVLAVALRRWLGERRAWRMTDQTSSRRQITPGVAAQVVFCLEQLEQLPTTRPEHAWLWRLRAKVVGFIVSSHGLRDLAKSYVLTDEEKAEIARTDALLHSPAPRDAATESDEVRKVRAELRRRLQGLTTWGVGRGTYQAPGVGSE